MVLLGPMVSTSWFHFLLFACSLCMLGLIMCDEVLGFTKLASQTQSLDRSNELCADIASDLVHVAC